MNCRIGRWVAALMVFAVAVVTACGSEEPATPTPIEVTTTEARSSVSPTPASIPTPIPTSAPTPTPTKTLTPTIAASPQPTEQPPSTATPTATATPVAPYDSNAIMHSLSGDILSDSFYYSSAMDEQLAAIKEHRDLSQVPVLIELMRFRIGLDINAALEELTGQNFGGNWKQWMEWLGKNASDYAPPEDYPDWKSRLYSIIHPRFWNFLRDTGETARVDLTEVVWGGVIPDGIPDLTNPTTLTVAEAEYLFPDDRVFGVSINGEHRAYPLRIINAHEMANDFLGGEPISVLW